MSDKRIREIIEECQRLCRAASRLPFPYEDSRTLLREAGGQYDGLIPDLDVFFSTIAGYCSWQERVLKWSEEQVREAEVRLANSFFERFPRYGPLERLITESDTPTLHAHIATYEKIRACLLELFREHRGTARGR